ncbi:MAG: hypothetical protein CM1200mP37_5590 [Chloroflexota bacterium]|nr:MAG: hypothetical protein CM1200mP37_5590 [Chloroflexota bacterium]
MNKIDLPFDIPEGFGAILYEPNEMPLENFPGSLLPILIHGY